MAPCERCVDVGVERHEASKLPQAESAHQTIAPVFDHAPISTACSGGQSSRSARAGIPAGLLPGCVPQHALSDSSVLLDVPR